METSPQSTLGTISSELGALSWMLILSGLISIVIGILALVAPLPTLAALILLFGAYAIVDGAVAFVAATRALRHHRRAWPQVVHGVAGLLVGVITFASPPVTGVVLLVIVAIWAMVIGVLELVTAVRLSRATHHAWLFALYGVISLSFGAFLLLSPAGLFAVAALIGMYALVRGTLATWVGVSVRRAIARA